MAFLPLITPRETLVILACVLAPTLLILRYMTVTISGYILYLHTDTFVWERPSKGSLPAMAQIMLLGIVAGLFGFWAFIGNRPQPFGSFGYVYLLIAILLFELYLLLINKIKIPGSTNTWLIEVLRFENESKTVEMTMPASALTKLATKNIATENSNSEHETSIVKMPIAIKKDIIFRGKDDETKKTVEIPLEIIGEVTNASLRRVAILYVIAFEENTPNNLGMLITGIMPQEKITFIKTYNGNITWEPIFDFKLNYTFTPQPQFKKNELFHVTDGERQVPICLDGSLNEETVAYFKQHPDKKLIVLERGLTTTDKWNLKYYMGDNFVAF